MSVFGCCFCGERLYYHGEPEDKYPVEHYFCTLESWRELETENLPADSIEVEHEHPFIKSWRCWRCGSFSFFLDGIHLSGVYVPKDEFSDELMQEPFEFGPFWNDFQWFEITESDITAAEILTKFLGNYWLAKNENEMRIYEDEACTKCVGQFRRLQIITPVTVQTMSLNSFKKMIRTYDDEINFFYKNLGYELIKEKLADSQIKITVNRNFDNPQCVYQVTVKDDEDFVENLISAKIFSDGKSIIEAQAEVKL